MALQVWLPLTKDLRNQGLADVTVTNNGATFNSAGKLGGCYSFPTTGGNLDIPSNAMSSFISSNGCSLAFWIKLNAWNTGYETYFQAGTGSTPWNNYIFGILRNNTASTVCFTIGNGSTVSNASYLTSAWETGVWFHMVFTYETGKCKIYKNGVLDKEYTTSIVPDFSKITKITIGRCNNNSSYQTNCNMNDIRIYNHCLSPMEVKLISQGLILHYPLNRQGLGPSNLIKNGFGELGTENWTSSANISTTDIPSDQSDIKISVSNNYTVERIKIYSTHTYKFSTWIKATTTSGSTYPSLFPYDVDGKFIDYYKCSDGFNLNTMTTLKQQLKTGDTKIYVNDLSQWNANSGHYYNWAAIFSYTDGTGYTYPDGTYTQNLGRFGTSTNAKTNLDKTNNIITLTTAYTGPNMPIGTKLCASTEGSTYYYPLGGINLTNIQDWTYKEANFSASVARLKYAKEVTFWTYSNNRMAGIKLQDLTNENLDTVIEYDCSGFCNNGTRTGTFTWTSDTPKYNISVKAKENKITIPGILASGTNEFSFSIWVKRITRNTNAKMLAICIGNKFFNFGEDGGSSNQFMVFENGGSDWWQGSSFTIPLNEWHHYAGVFTGIGTKLYIDGQLRWETTTVQSYNLTQSYSVILNSQSNLLTDAYISDVRIYATALSADDVKSLYQNCATIDPDGTIRGQIRS